MVAIIDYGMGNVSSVQKALNFLKIENIITDDIDCIKNSTSIILPGVGSFSQGMENLKKKGLDHLLHEEVMVNKKKILGICLGMQLMMKFGTEPHESEGLGWIEGNVVKIEQENLIVPHMGWNNLVVINNDYYDDLNGKDFYFIHSYHVLPKDSSVIAATVNYGFDIVASIQYQNIFATQFHPEKSQKVGLKLLETYFKQNA